MLTRCPGCAATFRITPEQLRARNGQVKCGKCATIFNALEGLLEEVPPPLPASAQQSSPAALPVSTTASTPSPPDSPMPEPAETATAAAAPTDTPIAAFASLAAVDLELDAGPARATAPPAPADLAVQNAGTDEPTPPAPADLLLEHPAAAEPDLPQAPAAPPDEPAIAPPEETTAAARAAGLVAVRERSEIPGYNRWAEGGIPSTGELDPPARPRWPFVLAVLALILALTGQIVYQFRSEIVIASPAARPLIEAACAHAGCTIPLPRHSDLVSIEASDLQIDPGRNGLLILSATLRNRAVYDQQWPHLELTLTNQHDEAILRRVLAPTDYLIEATAAAMPQFATGSDRDVRLWLRAEGLSAAGYRLFVFYP